MVNKKFTSDNGKYLIKKAKEKFADKEFVDKFLVDRDGFKGVHVDFGSVYDDSNVSVVYMTQDGVFKEYNDGRQPFYTSAIFDDDERIKKSLKLKGVVDKISDLPQENNEENDMYAVKEKMCFYLWSYNSKQKTYKWARFLQYSETNNNGGVVMCFPGCVFMCRDEQDGSFDFDYVDCEYMLERIAALFFMDSNNNFENIIFKYNIIGGVEAEGKVFFKRVHKITPSIDSSISRPTIYYEGWFMENHLLFKVFSHDDRQNVGFELYCHNLKTNNGNLISSHSGRYEQDVLTKIGEMIDDNQQIIDEILMD